MFAARREIVVMYKPQTVFYAGREEDVKPLAFTSRDWKMLWICYCISTALVVLTLYLCLSATLPLRVAVGAPTSCLMRRPHARATTAPAPLSGRLAVLPHR